MTESKTPLASEKMSEPNTKVSSSKDATKKSNSKDLSPDSSPNKVSKLAIFALLIALAAPSGHYYWQQLQNQQISQTLSQKISEESSSTLTRYKNQIEQTLKGQEQTFAQQLQQMAEKIHNTSQAKITELDENVKRLEQQIKQRQPSDWLLHEAEYLIRISARTLWLEHDTSAAIGLLKDADARLSELNNPTFLPVRETIHQDINALEVMPSLETDEVILTLMAMNKQVTQLPLSIIDLDAKKENGVDLSLSDDINDWQTNLAKTWQKFLNDFIRVRQRSGSIEPLMSPEQQENLTQNLSLKIQLAIWAASERNGVIYQKALVDIQQWLNEFFDMKTNINQQVDKTLANLQQKQVNYDYPSELSSLSAIKLALINQAPKPSSSSLKEADQIENEPLPTPHEEVKTEADKPVKLPEAQQNVVKSEGNA